MKLIQNSFRLIFHFMCLSALPPCTYVHSVSAWYQQRSQEALTPLEQEGLMAGNPMDAENQPE